MSSVMEERSKCDCQPQSERAAASSMLDGHVLAISCLKSGAYVTCTRSASDWSHATKKRGASELPGARGARGGDGNYYAATCTTAAPSPRLEYRHYLHPWTHMRHTGNQPCGFYAIGVVPTTL
jgi:hypothetical protein